MSDDRLSDYVDVAERIQAFYAEHPQGSLQPLDPAQPFRWETIPDVGRVLVYVACAYRSPDDPRPGIGTAWEPFPGRTPYTRGSELMVAETSAWGRAIAALGIATRRSIATRQDVERARARQQQPDPDPQLHDGPPPRPRTAMDRTRDALGLPRRGDDRPATQPQLTAIGARLGQLGVREPVHRRQTVVQLLGLDRPLTSSAELTVTEASRVLDATAQQLHNAAAAAWQQLLAGDVAADDPRDAVDAGEQLPDVVDVDAFDDELHAALDVDELHQLDDPDVQQLLDPDCRAGKHGSCVRGPCTCGCHDDDAAAVEL